MNIEIVTANNFYKESMSALFAKNLGKLCAAKYNRDTLKVFILPDDADCIYLPHSSELLDADYAVVFCTPAIKRIFPVFSLTGMFALLRWMRKEMY